MPRQSLYRIRQFYLAVSSLLAQPDQQADAALLALYLSPDLQHLFRLLPAHDRRHSLAVANHLLTAGQDAPALLQAALLHDVGKSVFVGGRRVWHVPLWARVLTVLLRLPLGRGRLARVGGPGAKGWQRALYVNVHHGELGADLLRGYSLDSAVVELVLLHQRPPQVGGPPLLRALQQADDRNLAPPCLAHKGKATVMTTTAKPNILLNRLPAYEVQLPQFSGPLALLLRLIEKDELEITCLSLAAVADQYLVLVRADQGRRDPAEMASFLVLAAKLLQIKSQQLLPRPAAAAANAPDEDDVAEELIRSLQEYRRIKELVAELRPLEGLVTYLRQPLPTPPRGAAVTTDYGLTNVSLAQLAAMARRRMQLALSLDLSPGAGEPSPLQPHRITVNGRLKELQAALQQGAVSYRAVLAAHPAASRSGRVQEAVVTFLAILEVQRRRLGRVAQSELYGDITINPTEGADG